MPSSISHGISCKNIEKIKVLYNDDAMKLEVHAAKLISINLL